LSPIRAENLARYPANWSQIRARIQVRAQNACEFCGVRNWALGGRDGDGNFLPAHPIGEASLRLVFPKTGDRGWCGKDGPQHFLRIIRIVCTVAHLDHVPENCSDENLRFLCQRCHLAHDAKHHAETRYRTRREGKASADLFDSEATAA
jgi:hypothetical protein